MNTTMYAMKDVTTQEWLEYKGHDHFVGHNTLLPQHLYTADQKATVGPALNPEVVSWVTVHVTVEGSDAEHSR